MTAPTTNSTGRVIAFLANALVFRGVVLGITLFSAGRWDWFWAWLSAGIFYAFDVLSIVLVDPSLLAERSRRSPDQKAWDRPLVGFAVVLLPISSVIVAGLDERFGWRPDAPVIAQGIAAAVVAVGYAVTIWAMRANAYFSAVMRIQTDRGHQVASGGPYRIVRHPGYVGAMLFTLAAPVALGSLWGLIPALIAAVLYVIRTQKEDDALQAELPGYHEFTQQTRFRLIPGVW